MSTGHFLARLQLIMLAPEDTRRVFMDFLKKYLEIIVWLQVKILMPPRIAIPIIQCPVTLLWIESELGNGNIYPFTGVAKVRSILIESHKVPPKSITETNLVPDVWRDPLFDKRNED